MFDNAIDPLQNVAARHSQASFDDRNSTPAFLANGAFGGWVVPAVVGGHEPIQCLASVTWANCPAFVDNGVP